MERLTKEQITAIIGVDNVNRLLNENAEYYCTDNDDVVYSASIEIGNLGLAQVFYIIDINDHEAVDDLSDLEWIPEYFTFDRNL